MNPHTNNIDIGPRSQLHINIHCNTHDIDLANKEIPTNYPATPHSVLFPGKARPVLQPYTFPEYHEPLIPKQANPLEEPARQSSSAAFIAPGEYAPRKIVHTKAGSGGIFLKDCVEDRGGETGLKTYLPTALERRRAEEHYIVNNQEEYKRLSKMGLAYNVYLSSSKIYGCKNCKTHLSNHDDIVSRNFRGQHGKAYLFDSVVNIIQGEAGERNMTTGRHIVRDIMCKQCNETVGWKYDKAYEQAEKYKEGKYILEAELLCQVT